MPNSHLLLRCLGVKNPQIQTSFALISKRWVPSVLNWFTWPTSLQSPSTFKKKSSNKRCLAVQYQTDTKLVWFLGKKTWQVLRKTKKLSKLLQCFFLLCPTNRGCLRPWLTNFQLWVPSHETSMIPHWGQRCSDAGYIRSGPVDFGRNPLANRYYNSHFVANSRSMTRNKLGKKNIKPNMGLTWGDVFLKKQNTEPSKFNAFCFPLNINLICYIPKMPTETNGENSTQLQGCDSPL